MNSIERSNEILNEDMTLLIDNSFSDASFSINHDYGKEYSECVKRLNPLVEEKYFNVFSNSKREKITNTISPYSQETITWATVYTRVIRKIINPLQITQGKLFLSLEELDRHIAVVLQNRDLFKNNDTSSSEPIKGKIEINERLEKESENYIPKLISRFSFIKQGCKKEDDNLPKRVKANENPKFKKKASMKNQPFRKQSAFDLRRKNKLTTASALNKLNLVYENHNSPHNMLNKSDGKGSEVLFEANDISKVIELQEQPPKSSQKITFSNLTQRLAAESQCQKKRTELVFHPSKVYAATPANSKLRNMGIMPGNFGLSQVKEKVKRKVTIVKDNMATSSFKKFNEYRQIPFEDNYFSINHYKPVEKMAYRDELERYNPNKKINYGFYVTKENENTFKEMFDLIDFQPITLDSNKFTSAELQKRGERIAAYKSMSNDLIHNILKVNHFQ